MAAGEILPDAVMLQSQATLVANRRVAATRPMRDLAGKLGLADAF